MRGGTTDAQFFVLAMLKVGGELREEFNVRANRDCYEVTDPQPGGLDPVTVDARTVRVLLREGWIEVVPHTAGRRWSSYRITGKGLDMVTKRVRRAG